MSDAKVNAAVKELTKLGNDMQELGNTSSRIGQQYEAHMTLYNVAAATGDEQAMATERQTLHDLLDHLLDNGAQIGLGQRKREQIIRSCE